MRFLGGFRRRKEGAGSIIGAIFVVLILLSGLTFYSTYLGITDHYNETVGTMGDLGRSQNQERIVIKQVRLTAANNLNLTVENDGAVQSHLIWIGVFNKSAVPEDQRYYALDEHLNPSEKLSIVSNFTVVQGLKYAIQLVTELGNTVQNVFYPASEVRCALSLTAASPTAYEGNNVTVMLTVTHNDTEVDAIQSLTASTSAAPSGLVQLVDNSPLTVNGLTRGGSAFFWWIYNTTDTGTVVFNATYSPASAGAYALANVNILASLGQGGGSNVTVTGVNGTAEYNPSQWNPLGSTQYVSGSIADLASNDSSYAVFRSYHTGTSTDINHSVDNNSFNVDGSPNLGTHSNFTALQYGPDSIYDTSTEGDYGTNTQDYVDQLSNVDGSADKGSHSNFNAQKAGPDGSFDTLTETNTGQTTTETLRPTGPGTITQLSRSGASANWNCVDDVSSDGDSTYVYSTSTSLQRDTYATQNHTSGSGTISSLSIHIMTRENFVDGYARTIIGTHDTNYESSDFALTGSYADYSSTYATNPNTGAAWTWEEVDAVECGVALRTTMAGWSTRCTQVWIVVSYAPTDYELDVEVQFTSVDYSQTNEYLCIYAGTVDSENLRVDVRTGSNWITVVSALQPNQWNNVSISSYLTDSTFTIRFNGATETGDTTQNSWNIDCSLLHVWTPNYRLDLEIQFTSVDYDEDNEQLCIYAGNLDSENLRVDYWTGSAWSNLLTDLNPGWNNVTVSLSSSNFTIRFNGGSETGDTNQDSWNLDVALLHIWSNEYTSEVEFTGSSDLQTWTSLLWQIQSCWDISQVTVTIQFYNFTLGNYMSSGTGYVSYVSNAIPNTDEMWSQTEPLSPNDFKNSTGNWRVKIKGVKSKSTQFLMKVDWIDLQIAYSTTGDTIPYAAWQLYSLKATTASGDPIPYAYVSIYANGTLVYFRNAIGKVDIGNPAWVRLDAGGQYLLEVKSASGSAETWVLYAVVGSVVGQKTVTQEAP